MACSTLHYLVLPSAMLHLKALLSCWATQAEPLEQCTGNRWVVTDRRSHHNTNAYIALQTPHYKHATTHLLLLKHFLPWRV
jgi:hypothetical protein